MHDIYIDSGRLTGSLPEVLDMLHLRDRRLDVHNLLATRLVRTFHRT